MGQPVGELVVVLETRRRDLRVVEEK